MRTLLRLKLKKQKMDNESVDTMKEENDDQKSKPSSPAAASTNNDPSTSPTHELQKDTDSSEKAAIATGGNDANNQLSNTQVDNNDDEELIISDGENVLSLIPQILRSAVERSRQAEELILREGMINNDVVAPTNETEAVIDEVTEKAKFTKVTQNHSEIRTPMTMITQVQDLLEKITTGDLQKKKISKKCWENYYKKLRKL